MLVADLAQELARHHPQARVTIEPGESEWWGTVGIQRVDPAVPSLGSEVVLVADPARCNCEEYPCSADHVDDAPMRTLERELVTRYARCLAAGVGVVLEAILTGRPFTIGEPPLLAKGVSELIEERRLEVASRHATAAAYHRVVDVSTGDNL